MLCLLIKGAGSSLLSVFFFFTLFSPSQNSYCQSVTQTIGQRKLLTVSGRPRQPHQR
ncbi:hypothetical protein HanRHA438_Chr04g0165691 [Helianthus annuus]|uniref:Uncharacterized protein n=1 Tax=Helianthus annuus TaxID=4232 RepID=A0A251V010_HELAN|nr:hypothetical protein HanXRQr2_Chr04g0155601 [Helianthus annuus]KAJ0580318.1 hypothetical protein HanHA300_Chr04g0127861 [Helianthus annuus]KAJ0596264.1 hypothetical protein HanHA89_Chr04g0140801 [Helianthus annuus]KAJ0925968.1 hypothetical protein HanRHA438_Chr04g0165691 [Helianthus annuus]KAJ0930465.1 hypothetical protein HanPSC8_Chr04g0149621 [Helianthus annuus]